MRGNWATRILKLVAKLVLACRLDPRQRSQSRPGMTFLPPVEMTAVTTRVLDDSEQPPLRAPQGASSLVDPVSPGRCWATLVFRVGAPSESANGSH